MATDKQIAANRLNAQKATGPKTPRGKAISSMNALKTGINARGERVGDERQVDFDQLIAEYYRDFAPVNAIERALLDQLVRSEWLLRRYAAAEPLIWTMELMHSRPEDAGKAFFQFEDTLLKLDRVRNSAHRNYSKALKELMALRKARNAEDPVHETAQPPAQPEPAEPLIPELGSFYTFPQPPIEINQPDEDDPPIAA